MAAVSNHTQMFNFVKFMANQPNADLKMVALWTLFKPEDVEAAPVPVPVAEAAPESEPEIVEVAAVPAAAPKPNSFLCDDFAQMVQLGVFPIGTAIFNQRRDDIFKGAVQMQNLSGGAREAKIVSAPHENGWVGGVFASPSGFLKEAGQHLTVSNPSPVKARNGWKHARVGSLQGPTLDVVRTAWKNRGVEAAKEIVLAAQA